MVIKRRAFAFNIKLVSNFGVCILGGVFYGLLMVVK